MGMYGSYFFVFIRAVVCIIWYGIQTYYAANLLSVCFRCVFGGSWHSWANALPAGADVTSKQLLSFFVIWLAEFPFVSVPVFRDAGRALTFASDLGAPSPYPLHLYRQGHHHAVCLLRALWLVHGARNGHLQH